MFKLLLSFLMGVLYVYFLIFGHDVIQLILQGVVFGLLFLLVLGFSWSLMKNNTPIITRYALLMGSEDTIDERRYTRKVTVVWVLFFMVLLLYKVFIFLEMTDIGQNGLLEIYFYLGTGVLFMVEFYVRPFFLPSHKGNSFISFLIGLSQISLKNIWQFDRTHKI
ncbi:hypothetical protein MNBD_GAMMA03-383 [hydrothermal vent metagenome]|uniref:Uncharacterized protein n=1 Tax=hydrothermal vent metagenome TaxID=652676 RepID=A0A3B0WBM1_9ZZZZ